MILSGSYRTNICSTVNVFLTFIDLFRLLGKQNHDEGEGTSFKDALQGDELMILQFFHALKCEGEK